MKCFICKTDLFTEPTCALPNVQHGKFKCKTKRGSETLVVRDGDTCTLTCDAGLFLVVTINPVATCHTFGNTGHFDKTSSCSKYLIPELLLYSNKICPHMKG